MTVDEPLRTELLERASRDQQARNMLRSAHSWAAWQETVGPVDADNTTRMLEIIDEYGWPVISLVGEDGAHAAWLLIQHAPGEVQERCLPLLEEAAGRGEASPVDLAYLTDRVLMHRGLPQIYGTQYQVDLELGQVLLWEVQGRDGLDARRAALGLPAEADNRARLQAENFPPDDQP